MKTNTFFRSTCILIIAALSYSTSAQRKVQFRKVDRTQDAFIEADYEVIKNNPNNALNVYLGLVPFYAEAYVPNFNFGANAEFGFIIKNRLALNAQARYAYIDRGNEIRIKDNIPYEYNDFAIGNSIFDSRPLTEMEVMGNLILFKKMIRKEERVSAFREGHIHYKTKIAANRLRMFSLRFGHSWHESYYGTTAINTYDYLPLQAISLDPTILQHSNVIGGSMHNYKAYIAGISLIRKSGLKIEFERYGKRRMMHQIEYFLDFIYAYEMNLENMLVTNEAIYPDFVECNLQEENKIIPYGFRLGIKEVNLGIAGWFSTIELGMRPGYVDYHYNLYAMLKIGFNIAANL